MSLALDHLYDSDAGVAVSPAALPCSVCGGQRRLAEPFGARPWHDGCYRATAQGRTPVPVTAATLLGDYEPAILAGLHAALFPLAKAGPSGNYDIWGAVGLTGAVLARHCWLPGEHWAVQLAIDTVERLLALQDAIGRLVQADGFSAADFVMTSLGEALLYLRRYIAADTYARWLAAYVRLGVAFVVPIGTAKPESAWYTNFNRECFELGGYAMLAQLTGDRRWAQAYETQLAFMCAPPPFAGGSDGLRRGWVQVTPTKGYGIERGGHDDRVILGPDGKKLDGYDPNYSLLAVHALTRLWLHNRDPRVAKMIGQIVALLQDRVSVLSRPDKPQILDGTNGSRQNNACSFGPVALAVLPGYTPAQTAAAWVETARAYGGDLTSSPGLVRGVNVEIVPWLMAMPTWPGDPA